MALIPQVKCSRCDRKYSGLRSRCPYCGARRSKKGKRVSEADNSMWKLIIGVVLLVVLIAAVVVLLVTTLSGKRETKPVADDKKDTEITQHDDGTNVLEDEDKDKDKEKENEETGEPTGTDEPGGTDEPQTVVTPAINSIKITYLGYSKEDITMSRTEVLQLDCKVDPSDTGLIPVWESSNEDVFVVLQTGKVTAIGPGTATLTVTVGNATAECIIRVG